MNEYPRRRRAVEPEEPPSGGGIPIFPLILVVVFAGLLLGGVLAHFMQRGPSPATTAVAVATPTPQTAVSPVPVVTPEPAATSSPSPHPSSSPNPSASPKPTTRPSARPLASPTASPAARVANVVASATPTPAGPLRIITPPPLQPKHTTKPAAPAAPVETQAPAVQPGVGGADRATSIVRSYLGALARGDQSSATSYLQSGLPNESFMNGGKVTSVRATAEDAGRYKVSANIATPGGEYFETFTLEPGPQGLVIVDHTAIKPE